MFEHEFEFVRTDQGCWALADAGPRRLGALLREFEASVEPTATTARLSPGLPVGEIHAQFAKSGLSCPDELVVWFGWHNGYAPDDPDASFTTPSIRIESLAAMLSRGMIGDTTWMALGNGPGTVVVDTATPADELLRVSAYDVELNLDPTDESGSDGRTASLSTLVAWWLIGVRQGGYVWDGRQWEGKIPLLAKTQQESLVW